MKLVTTPVPGYHGKVGGVTFVDGQAKVADNATELAYFLAQGYGIDDFDVAVDAAQDADDENTAEKLSELSAQAGTPDNDPLVVAEVDGVAVPLPRKSASAAAWREFAVDHGDLSKDDAARLSRDELVARFTQNDEDEEAQP